MSEEGELITYLLPPLMDREDEEQEIQLALLLGLRKLRRPRNIAYGRELSYGNSAPDWASPITATTYYNEEAAEKLITWMFQQQAAIQHAVIEYLEDSSQENLLKVVKLVVGTPVKQPIPVVTVPQTDNGGREGSLAALLVRSLRNQPGCSMEDLYKVARAEHQAKRPEAAVRQFIRRMVRGNKVKENPDGTYSINT